MRTAIVRISRWGAIPALLFALTASVPAGPISAQGVGDNAAARPSADRASVVPSEARASAHRPSFVFPERSWLEGIGWEIDTGGPAVRIERFFEND